MEKNIMQILKLPQFDEFEERKSCIVWSPVEITFKHI